MALQPGKSKTPASKPPEGRGARDAASDLEDADMTEGKDRDLSVTAARWVRDSRI
jgi:hypothetical protein